MDQEQACGTPNMGLRRSTAKTAYNWNNHSAVLPMLESRAASCERWQDEDATAQGVHHEALKPWRNSCSTTLEMMITNKISYRANTSSAAREEATP